MFMQKPIRFVSGIMLCSIKPEFTSAPLPCSLAKVGILGGNEIFNALEEIRLFCSLCTGWVTCVDRLMHDSPMTHVVHRHHKRGISCTAVSLTMSLCCGVWYMDTPLPAIMQQSKLGNGLFRQGYLVLCPHCTMSLLKKAVTQLSLLAIWHDTQNSTRHSRSSIALTPSNRTFLDGQHQLCFIFMVSIPYVPIERATFNRE